MLDQISKDKAIPMDITSNDTTNDINLQNSKNRTTHRMSGCLTRYPNPLLNFFLSSPIDDPC